ncbi:ABC transporter substrate-binding protein [Frisingicoccus sp.]|uniref:ABC transporter substrate-binding protein n=1 Tax=Frisingicoccus sp. TaxID=1918627 RepID=UPI003866A64A
MKILNIKRGLTVLALTGVFLCGCGRSESSDQSDNSVLKIGVLNTADSAVLFAAQSDNLFEEYGAEVKLVTFGSASDQSKAAEAGEIDGMMTDLIVQGLINKSEDCHLQSVLVALGDKAENGKFVIAAAPGNEHNTIDKLSGAKVAISEGTSMEFLLDSYCDVLGIPLSSIEKVNVPSISLRMEMLLEGSDIDCAILPEPLGDYSAMKGSQIVIDDTQLDVNLSVSVIALEADYIENHKENVEDFIDAYEEAAKRMNGNKDGYRQIVLDTANVPEEMQDSYVIPDYSERNVPDEELFNRVQAWMVSKGMISEPYDYEYMIVRFE